MGVIRAARVLQILPNYGGIIGLFGVVLYVYAVASIIFVSTDRVIVNFGRGEGGGTKTSTFELIADYDSDMRLANFNSMFDALITLLQLFVGEAWDGVMIAASAAKGQFIT